MNTPYKKEITGEFPNGWKTGQVPLVSSITFSLLLCYCLTRTLGVLEETYQVLVSTQPPGGSVGMCIMWHSSWTAVWNLLAQEKTKPVTQKGKTNIFILRGLRSCWCCVCVCASLSFNMGVDCVRFCLGLPVWARCSLLSLGSWKVQAHLLQGQRCTISSGFCPVRLCESPGRCEPSPRTLCHMPSCRDTTVNDSRHACDVTSLPCWRYKQNVTVTWFDDITLCVISFHHNPCHVAYSNMITLVICSTYTTYLLFATIFN